MFGFVLEMYSVYIDLHEFTNETDNKITCSTTHEYVNASQNQFKENLLCFRQNRLNYNILESNHIHMHTYVQSTVGSLGVMTTLLHPNDVNNILATNFTNLTT